MKRPAKEFKATSTITLPGTDYVLFYAGDHLTCDQAETLASSGIEVLTALRPLVPPEERHYLLVARCRYLADLDYKYARRTGSFKL